MPRILEDFSHAYYVITSVLLVLLLYETIKMVTRVTEIFWRNKNVETNVFASVHLFKKISSKMPIAALKLFKNDLNKNKNIYEVFIKSNQQRANCMLLIFSEGLPGGTRKCFVRDSGT